MEMFFFTKQYILKIQKDGLLGAAYAYKNKVGGLQW